MKRETLLSLGGLAGGLALTACMNSLPPRKTEFLVSPTAARVSEGRRLTMLMCATCHYDPTTRRLTGNRMRDLPGFVGQVYSRNLTHHPTAGIERYDDAELAYLLR